MARHSSNRNSSPLDAAALRQLAIAYVGRYATTRAKLVAYLQRKLRERGWAEEAESPEASVMAIVERVAELGYVDDRAFAEARAGALGRRGYGPRRVVAALRGAGIAESDAAEIGDVDDATAATAAHVFARRRRIGPYAASPAGDDLRRRQLAAMLRAGHSYAIARAIVGSDPEMGNIKK